MPLAAVISMHSEPAVDRSRGNLPRRVLLAVHRYVGLAIAVFLLVAGMTGSVLVFYHELDAALNPHLFAITPPSADTPMLDPCTLRDRLQAKAPGQAVDSVVLERTPGHSVHVWMSLDGGPARECFVDPYTGRILGSRAWGDLSEGLVNLMPFLYRLHYQLALDEVGTLLFGIVALLWTIDCFVGLVLTFPPSRPASAASDGRSWLARWRPAWVVRAGSLFGAIFTVHRAAGLWLWVLLLVFAWSAVGFNLRPVFTPVMGAVLTTTDVWAALPSLDPPRQTPRLGWQQSLTVARQVMAAEAERRQFTIASEGALTYAPGQGLYRYDVYSSLDLGDRWPATRIWFDGDSGALHAFDAPTGVASGNTVTAWLFALHMGTVGGLAYRLLVVVVGLVVATLSLTGVLIWWRKRRRTGRPSPDQTDPRQPPPARTNPNATP